ncbi:IucA/IucC family protein, partial [Vibrio lentus]
SPTTMLEQLAPDENNSAGTMLYPCHPWEVYTLLQNPVVKTAIEQGKIIPLGLGGKKLLPTSSVRTLYHPDMDWFAKFSINVRLTNCVRKNAWY